MAPPPLPPLSCVAGSLALSFTGVAQPTARATDAPLSLEVPEPPPPATPSAAPTQPEPDLTTPPPPSVPPVADVKWFGSSAPAPVVAATRPSLLRPSEKRFFFSLFVGGSKTLLGGYGSPYGGGGMDFKLEGAIGGHGKVRKALAGAAVVQIRTGTPFSSFTLAPRLQWDKQIVPDHAIYLTTSVTFGYRMTSYSTYGIAGLLEGAYHGGVAAFGWGVSAIVADRLLLSFRPVNPEIEYNGLTGFVINWDVFGGLGVVW